MRLQLHTILESIELMREVGAHCQGDVSSESVNTIKKAPQRQRL